jgi:hypothetical protein
MTPQHPVAVNGQAPSATGWVLSRLSMSFEWHRHSPIFRAIPLLSCGPSTAWRISSPAWVFDSIAEKLVDLADLFRSLHSDLLVTSPQKYAYTVLIDDLPAV